MSAGKDSYGHYKLVTRDDASGWLHTWMLGSWWLRHAQRAEVAGLPIVPAVEAPSPPAPKTDIAGAAAEAAWKRDSRAVVKSGVSITSTHTGEEGGRLCSIVVAPAEKGDIFKAVDLVEMIFPNGESEFVSPHVMCGSVGERGSAGYELVRPVTCEDGSFDVHVVLYWHRLAGKGKPTRFTHPVDLSQAEPLVRHYQISDGTAEEEPNAHYPFPF